MIHNNTVSNNPAHPEHHLEPRTEEPTQVTNLLPKPILTSAGVEDPVAQAEALVRWVNDVHVRMWNRVDDLKEDLDSDDDAVREAAEHEITQLLDWLLPPRTPQQIEESKDRKRNEVVSALKGCRLTKEQTRKMVESVSVRPRGRPREKGHEAIRALRLNLTTTMSWREIALVIEGPCKDRGCKSYCSECGDVKRSSVPLSRSDKKRNFRARCRSCKFRIRPAAKKETVCFKCADAMRDLADQLRTSLDAKGLLPPLLELETPGEK